MKFWSNGDGKVTKLYTHMSRVEVNKAFLQVVSKAEIILFRNVKANNRRHS